MARYNIGDKVRTTDVWNNGMGILIPKGSIVEIKCDNGEMCLCSIQGEVAWYEYKWLGGVVENGSINSKNKTNADRIRAMSDEELAELFTKLAWNSEVQTTPLKYLDWLQSEAE